MKKPNERDRQERAIHAGAEEGTRRAREMSRNLEARRRLASISYGKGIAAALVLFILAATGLWFVIVAIGLAIKFTLWVFS